MFGAASLVPRRLLRSSSGHLTSHPRVLSLGGTASAASSGVPAGWADAVPGISPASPGSPWMLLPAGSLLLTAERSFTWGGRRGTEKNPLGKWTGRAPRPGAEALGQPDLPLGCVTFLGFLDSSCGVESLPWFCKN